ncbi:MAG: AMP-binding protein [Pseudomonadota bacterium]
MVMSLRASVLLKLEASADRPQISVLGRRGQATHYTGSQLLHEAEHCLKQWADWFGPGPYVLVAALPAGEAFLFTLLASLIGESTLVPIAQPRANDPPGSLRHRVESCGATALLCTSAQREGIETQLRTAQGTLACPVVAVDAPNPTIAAIVRPRSPAVPIIQHTSGSTRFPKAVPIHAAQIHANCAMIQRLWGMDERTVMLNWLPHYHDMGLMGCILYPLLSGARSIQMSPFEMIRNPLSWLRAISDHRATFSGGPTFAFQECLTRVAEADCTDLDLSSWQRAFCGAEPVPAGLLERFRQRFGKHGLAAEAVFACYGMAEFTLFAAGEPGRHSALPASLADGATVEPCLLSIETRQGIRITDPRTGAALSDGESGEIWLKGASASEEYLGLPAETSQTFGNEADGARWMRTGDLGVIQGNWLSVTGRQKDIIIVNGRKIAAAEIEWLAAQQDPALNPMAAAAFMPPGAASGQAVLFIELRTGQPPRDDSAALIDRIRRAVAGAWSIELMDIRVLARGTLARTSSGKVRRQQIATTYLDIAPHRPEESVE